MKNNIKNLEIYRLPDGKDYFASLGQNNSFYLYPVENSSGSPIFVLTKEGQINHWQTGQKCFSLPEMEKTGRSLDGGKGQPKNDNKPPEPLPQSLFQMIFGDFNNRGK